MSHGQIDARGKWKRLQSYYMWFHSADHLCNDIDARAGEECATFVAERWRLSGAGVLPQRSDWGLGWSEVRESMLDAAIRRCWPNYVIKGA